MTHAARDTERNQFTHHRAWLMFAGHLHAHRRLHLPWSTTVHEGADPLAGETPAPPRPQARPVDTLGGL